MADGLTLDQATGQILERSENGSTVSLEPIVAALGGSYGLLFRAATRDGQVEEASCHGVDIGYVHRLKEASGEGLLPNWLGGLAAGSVVDRAVFGTDQQFGRTAFYNHVIRPEGRFHCVIATPFLSARHRFHLVIGRPRSSSDFDATNRHLLQCMLPQVGEILRLRAELAEAQLFARRAERAFDGLEAPLLIVDGNAAVDYANEAARRLFALRNGLWADAKGRLAAGTPMATEALRRAIKIVGTVQERRVVSCERGPTQAPVRLTLSRFDGPDIRQPGVRLPHVMIVAEVPMDHDGSERVAVLSRAYGLTPREVALVTHLVHGRTLQDTSRDLAMSYNTARSYLRQVFGKIDVHRQSDLLRLFVTGLRPEQGGVEQVLIRRGS